MKWFRKKNKEYVYWVVFRGVGGVSMSYLGVVNEHEKTLYVWILEMQEKATKEMGNCLVYNMGKIDN